MLGKTGKLLTRLLALGIVLALVGCNPAPPEMPEESPDPETPEAVDSPFTVRQAIASPYEPGAQNRVVVTMDYTGDEPVTALALQTEIPMGWQYAGISGELRPAIEPPAGARDVLTMVWITVPSFPATLEYMLDAPEELEGTCTLSAEAVYRTLGGELRSPVDEVTTSTE